MIISLLSPIKAVFQGIAALVIAGWCCASVAQGCPRYQAPGKFPNTPQVWGKTDTGVITDGFIDLQRSDSASKFDIHHGIDVSSNNQSIVYKKVSDCGGAFSFVRLDDSYQIHQEGLRAHKILPIPYTFWPIPKSLRRRAAFSDAGEGSSDLNLLLTRFDSVGSEAADRLIGTLTRLPGGLQKTQFGGLSAKLVAVDIEEKLIDEKGSNEAQRIAYGRSYARAVCTWLKRMNAYDRELVVIVYTTPSVYGDYLQYALKEDNACIGGLPIWLAHTTSDAGDSIYSSLRGVSSTGTDKAAQRLCLVSSGNRCIIHQYSHRAIFANPAGLSRQPPPSVDINRWFPAVVASTEVSQQFIRRDWMPRNLEELRSATRVARSTAESPATPNR